MSRKIPAESDWSDLLGTARETSLGLQPDDAVPHGSLASTVRDECDAGQGTASKWIGNAVQKGWLEQRGTGANREYVATDEDATLYDADAVDRFLGDDDVQNADVEAALDAAVDYYYAQLSDDQRWLIEGKWGIDRATMNDLRIGFARSRSLVRSTSSSACSSSRRSSRRSCSSPAATGGPKETTPDTTSRSRSRATSSSPRCTSGSWSPSRSTSRQPRRRPSRRSSRRCTRFHSWRASSRHSSRRPSSSSHTGYSGEAQPAVGSAASSRSLNR